MFLGFRDSVSRDSSPHGCSTNVVDCRCNIVHKAALDMH